MEKEEETGKRYNQAKPRLSLVEAEFTEGLAKVLTFGAEKYGVGNWKKGLKVTEVIDSLERHILEIKKGEVRDKESGLPHWAHAAANLMFLAHFEGGTWDDREGEGARAPANNYIHSFPRYPSHRYQEEWLVQHNKEVEKVQSVLENHLKYGSPKTNEEDKERSREELVKYLNSRPRFEIPKEKSVIEINQQAAKFISGLSGVKLESPDFAQSEEAFTAYLNEQIKHTGWTYRSNNGKTSTLIKTQSNEGSVEPRSEKDPVKMEDLPEETRKRLQIQNTEFLLRRLDNLPEVYSTKKEREALFAPLVTVKKEMKSALR